MKFEKALCANKAAVVLALGYGGATPDAKTAGDIKQAARLVENAVRPAWTFKQVALGKTPVLNAAGIALSGADIAKHLKGCNAVVVLALTLGAVLDGEMRAASAADVQRAVLMDAAASALAEQYANEAEALLRQQARESGLYLTGRFSPGYGDFPLAVQAALLRLVDAHKQIGLTVSAAGVMTPGKSITALLGLAKTPVRGHAAGCENCTLKGRCQMEKGACCDAGKN